MYLSALNYEDLDLDSDPKYELLRDAILEKVVMLTVAYFCIATELRLLSPNKNNKNIQGACSAGRGRLYEQRDRTWKTDRRQIPVACGRRNI